jgi:phytoene synthase
LAQPFAAVIRRHSKSFALAARLLPAAVRKDALVLYAYCRRADDAVDLAPPDRQPAALAALRTELDAVYAAAAAEEPLTAAFADVARRHAIPRIYPEELITGMEMDVTGTRYQGWLDVERYSYRVAGTVGLMMCHVMGVRDERALQHAADLGIGMQLTNICRDVREDWQRQRLYLPRELLELHGAGAVYTALGGPFPEAAAPALASTIREVLARAERYYASGDAGLAYLSPRCRIAIRSARLIYWSIGDELRTRGCDPRIGRVFVPRWRKLTLVARAVAETLRAQALAGARRKKGWPRAEA